MWLFYNEFFKKCIWFSLKYSLYKNSKICGWCLLFSEQAGALGDQLPKVTKNILITMMSLIFRYLMYFNWLWSLFFSILTLSSLPPPFDWWEPLRVMWSDMIPLAADSSITFRHRMFQVYLLYFLSHSWNKPFPQEVLAFFSGKW